ncbi:DUF262 domain-containing protein [Streptomyces mexicanus]|uniref:DUF262 domain-containing protein n=1 Tax=Streptomyces mexicanus TaxID=178566 RepID=A0A7X1LTQ2_9ACTN|nr:DUF262 domain-containing protein [Streptomyces mexicanus]MBC2869515.1 DUF262 domain-containing protein [Streptomyces mexicanus]
MSLDAQIASKAKEIHTDGYPMSIGEVLSLYRDGDIDVHPEFQRIFRWNDDQKSRLVESILLGIPIPPIFVSQRPDGIWDIIDGVQRLSTIFQFVGVYRDHEGRLAQPLILQPTEYLPALEGYTWEVATGSGKVFTDAMRRDFKRAKLEFRIIRKESDDNAKYDLFQRLNSGAQLSPQEARNCLLVMLNSDMFSRISELSENIDFRECIPLSDQKESQAYRQELVLRFFCQADFAGSRTELPMEYGEYLTRWMRNAAPLYDTDESPIDVDLFQRTFKLLNEELGEDAFRRFNGVKSLGPFSISSYEFVTSGVSANIDFWEENADQLAQRVHSVWGASEFRENSGTGVSPRRRVPRLILNSRRFFSSVD